MTQNDNILQELKELESTLHDKPSQNIYSVPGGYFENLAEQVLNRIRAMETDSVEKEISFLSPLVASIIRDMPYSVPAGYFEDLETRLSPVKKDQVYESSREELESISPLLSGLKKNMPYSIPADYFETLAPEPVPKPKVVSFSSRPWFRYAAAAVVTGVVAVTAFIFINKQNSTPEIVFKKFEKKLDKEIKKSSDQELNDFIKYTDMGQDLAYNQPKGEVKELLKDVPATELQKFLDEIADPEISAGETYTE